MSVTDVTKIIELMLIFDHKERPKFNNIYKLYKNNQNKLNIHKNWFVKKLKNIL